MGCDYYGSPALAPEPNVTSLAAPSEKTGSCQDSCCDIDDDEPLDTTASGQIELTPEKPDDCCSPSKCADSKTENHTDAPDCCRGKVSPCCDTSCLDRLAMRECEMSATAAPGLNSKPDSEFLLSEKGFQRFLTPFSL
jgi:Cu2+-exporting ATPase